MAKHTLKTSKHRMGWIFIASCNIKVYGARAAPAFAPFSLAWFWLSKTLKNWCLLKPAQAACFISPLSFSGINSKDWRPWHSRPDRTRLGVTHISILSETLSLLKRIRVSHCIRTLMRRDSPKNGLRLFDASAALALNAVASGLRPKLTAPN